MSTQYHSPQVFKLTLIISAKPNILLSYVVKDNTHSNSDYLSLGNDVVESSMKV